MSKVAHALGVQRKRRCQIGGVWVLTEPRGKQRGEEEEED